MNSSESARFPSTSKLILSNINHELPQMTFTVSKLCLSKDVKFMGIKETEGSTAGLVQTLKQTGFCPDKETKFKFLF